MFQNGMSEEVQNYFMQQEVPKHAHVESGRPYEVDPGLYRNQYSDARAQMMGQQYQQFPYAGAACPPKVANGDYLDPRLQHKGQLQQQYFEPVQQQPSYEQSYEFQRQQQAMLARQQELFMGQGQGLGVQLSRPQMVRPQMETFPLNMRNTPGQTFSSSYGITTDSDSRNAIGQQLVVKPLEVSGSFAGGQSESEAIENLHDLFGGVEKLFADDQIQETKSAIPGLGSLGASLINGCEAELFGDSLSSSLPVDPQFFGRSIQQAFKQTVENSKVNENLGDRRLDHNNYSQQVSGQIQGGSHYQGPTGGSYMQQQLPQSTSGGNYVNDGLFHQYGQSALQQPLARVDPQANERWQNNNSLSDSFHTSRNTQQNNQMSRNTLQLFKDMDESDSSAQSGYQTPGYEQGSKSQPNSFRESKVDNQDVFRQVGTTFSLAVQDVKQKANQQTEISQVHFPSQHASHISEGGLWSKQPNQASTFKYQPTSVGEAASNQTYRLQPDRLLLDAGKQHQSEEVQKLLSFGNSNPNVINAAQNLGGILGQANEDARLQKHQNEPAFKSPAYFEALEQQKQHQRFQEAQNISRVYSSNGQHHLASPGFSHLSTYASADSVVEGKANDSQTAAPSANALSWNVSGVRQTSTPDAWVRGSSNSLEPSIAFKSPPAKPVLGTNLISLSDKPSTPEVSSTKPAKWKEEAYVESTAVNQSSSTALTDRGSFYSERFDHKLSKNTFQRSERSESEGDRSEHKTAAVWPHLSNQGLQFPSTSSTFQDVSRRHVLSTKGETRPSAGPDVRHGGVSRPENTNHLIAVANQMKEKEDMMSTKVFQSSASTISTGLKSPAASTGPNLALMSSPSPSQSMAPPFQQERPTPSRISSEMQRISREAPAIAGQTSSIYGHSQHRPAESDSINDIVQQQHQARVTPSVTQLPVAAKSGAALLFSKPEQPKQMPFENRTIPVDPMQQLLSDSFRTSTPDERLSGPTPKHVEGSTEAAINNTDNSSTTKSSGNQFVAQSINTMNMGPMPIQQGLHQQLGMNFAALSHPNVAAMAHAKLSANQQLSQQSFQMSKEQHSVDLQRMNPAQAAQASTLQQQQLQAALQAYALARGGFLPNVSDRAMGSSTAAGARSNSNESPSLQLAVGQAMKQQLLLNSTFANAVLPKKRKSEIPPLIPWRMAISQLAGTLPTIRPSELQWAVDTNRLPEKEIDEEYYSQDESLQFVGRARQRLKLTTQMMQQTLPPVPAALMQSNSADDRECSIYTLARLSLGEACRITANEDVSYAKTNTLSATSELIVEGFRDRIKYLERALQRLESLPLTLEFVKNMQYLDKVCVTNRLMKCHQELFPVNFTSQRRIQQVQRSYPQPYVTVAPMPNTLPEGFQLISL